jgi:anti-sigma factor RsiW
MITEEQIWNYLDGSLTGADRKDFERSIAADKLAAALFQEISTLHVSLKAQQPLAPSINFTDRVMASLNLAPQYVPPAKLATALWIFILPIVLVVAGLAIFMAYNHVQLTGSLPVHIPMPEIKHPTLYFVVIDILVLAYFLESLSEYRFNRKTLFS